MALESQYPFDRGDFARGMRRAAEDYRNKPDLARGSRTHEDENCDRVPDFAAGMRKRIFTRSDADGPDFARGQRSTHA